MFFGSIPRNISKTNIHRGITNFCFGQIMRLNRIFLTIGKRAILRRILKVYGLDEIYEVSSSTFCVNICERHLERCGFPVRVRVRSSGAGGLDITNSL